MTNEEGALTQLYLATSREVVTKSLRGQYFVSLTYFFLFSICHILFKSPLLMHQHTDSLCEAPPSLVARAEQASGEAAVEVDRKATHEEHRGLRWHFNLRSCTTQRCPSQPISLLPSLLPPPFFLPSSFFPSSRILMISLGDYMEFAFPEISRRKSHELSNPLMISRYTP